MSRALLALALCACTPDYGPRLTAVEAEAKELRAKVESHERRLEEAERVRVVTDRHIDDVRSLCLIGGPKRRYNAGVRCSDGPFMPGSFGASAQRALWASGFCDEQILPKPVPMLVSR